MDELHAQPEDLMAEQPALLGGPELAAGVHFRFSTFGLKVQAEVTEYVPPSEESPARVSFRAWIDGTEPEAASALHAWLLEDLPGAQHER